MRISRKIQNAPRVPREQVKEAIEFLNEFLGEGERKWTEVTKESEARNIHWRALYKGKCELRVKKRQKKGVAYLRLPYDDRYGDEWHGDDKMETAGRYYGASPTEWITVICDEYEEK